MSKINYRIVGDGEIDVVVEMGLCSFLAEWSDAAKLIADSGHTVMLYERAGIGNSEKSKLPRTPENIAKELHELLQTVPHKEKLILLGHSQGGLYVQCYARLYPTETAGIVLLDPLSAGDNDFKERLSPDEMRSGGVDKFGNLGLARRLAKLHLGFIIKAVMKNAPPLYYYNYSDEDKRCILDCLTRADTYDTAIEEYKLSHEEKNIAKLRSCKGFPDIPLILVTHSSEKAMEETIHFGNTTEEIAEKVETVWQDIMGQYLSFSSMAEKITAEKSTHYIHLTEPETVIAALGRVGDKITP